MNIVRIIYTSLFYKVIIAASFVMSLILLFGLVPSLRIDGTDHEEQLLCGLGLLLVSVLYAIDLFVLSKKYKNNAVMYAVLFLQIILAVRI